MSVEQTKLPTVRLEEKGLLDVAPEDFDLDFATGQDELDDFRWAALAINGESYLLMRYHRSPERGVALWANPALDRIEAIRSVAAALDMPELVDAARWMENDELKLEEVFDPDQPRYPKGWQGPPGKAGQWRPKIAHGRGRIGPKGMANDIFYLKEQVRAQRQFWTNGAPPSELEGLGAEVEKLANRYSTAKTYRQRRDAIRAEMTEIRERPWEAYHEAVDAWRTKRMRLGIPLGGLDEEYPPEVGPRPSPTDFVPEEDTRRLKELADEEVKLWGDQERANRDAILGILNELRPMGGRKLNRGEVKVESSVVDEYSGIDTSQVIGGRQRPTAAQQREAKAKAERDLDKSLREVEKALPRDWIEESNAKGTIDYELSTERAQHNLDFKGKDYYAEMEARVDELLASGWKWVGRSGPWAVMENPDGVRVWLNWAGDVMEPGSEQRGPGGGDPVQEVVEGPREDKRAKPGELGWKSTIRVKPDDPSTALHEVLHRMEAILGEEQRNGFRPLNNRMLNFWYQRTGYHEGVRPTRLDELVPDSGYKPDEEAIPDEFFDPYVGKSYVGRSFGADGGSYVPTEVLTMGVQYLLYPRYRRDLREDDEMRRFMLGILAGL